MSAELALVQASASGISGELSSPSLYMQNHIWVTGTCPIHKTLMWQRLSYTMWRGEKNNPTQPVLVLALAPCSLSFWSDQNKQCHGEDTVCVFHQLTCHRQGTAPANAHRPGIARIPHTLSHALCQCQHHTVDTHTRLG